MAEAEKLIELTAEIVSSMVGNNNVATADVPVLIKSVHVALSGLGAPAPEPEVEKPKGAVSPRASIKADGLISMIDGKKYQTLRRHITRHGYTPETYRQAFGLPRDYPMTSANYSELRRGMAKLIGLGRKAAETVVEAVTPETAAPETAEPTPAEQAPAPAKPGRKPRAAKAASEAAPAPAETSAPAASVAEEAPAKPKRGRPRKVADTAAAPAEAQAAEAPADEAAPAPKKRRARK